jgi:1-acyl-sn-glycerol-3-phosphate acyltransferase
MMSSLLKVMFQCLFVRPLVLILIGLNVRFRERIPDRGPAIIAANHNSHLDSFILQSLFPLQLMNKVRPVAAADYFLRNKWIAWFSLKIIGIIPVHRKVRHSEGDPLSSCSEALEAGDILIIFPEGSRGEAEMMDEFKTGVAHLAQRHPEVPVYPLFLHGCGKALPRGEAIFVPFFVDAVVGQPMTWSGDRTEFVEKLKREIESLGDHCKRPAWD